MSLSNRLCMSAASRTEVPIIGGDGSGNSCRRHIGRLRGLGIVQGYRLMNDWITSSRPVTAPHEGASLVQLMAFSGKRIRATVHTIERCLRIDKRPDFARPTGLSFGRSALARALYRQPP